MGTFHKESSRIVYGKIAANMKATKKFNLLTNKDSLDQKGLSSGDNGK